MEREDIIKAFIMTRDSVTVWEEHGPFLPTVLHFYCKDMAFSEQEKRQLGEALKELNNTYAQMKKLDAALDVIQHLLFPDIGA